MRKLTLLFIFSMFLFGCTYTATSETGAAIDTAKVSLIQKGKTTESEITSMFGEPMTKIVVNETDTKWVYQHVVSSASSQMYTGKTSSSLKSDVLDILFRNGVVINFTHSKSDSSPTMKITSSM